MEGGSRATDKPKTENAMEQRIHSMIGFVRRWNDHVVILLNLELILLSYLSHSDAEIERLRASNSPTVILLSEDMLIGLAMLYLNFLAIKQLVMAMFYDTAFFRAEGAAKIFTIDLSNKKTKDNEANAYGSGLMALLHAIASYLADVLIILLITWSFGASAMTSFSDNVMCAFMLAVLMRESVTICKVPAAPKISANIKAVAKEDRTTASNSDDVTRPKVSSKIMTEEEVENNEPNQMPGQLE